MVALGAIAAASPSSSIPGGSSTALVVLGAAVVGGRAARPAPGGAGPAAVVVRGHPRAAPRRVTRRVPRHRVRRRDGGVPAPARALRLGPHLGDRHPARCRGRAHLGVYHAVHRRCARPTAGGSCSARSPRPASAEILVDELLHVVRARRFVPLDRTAGRPTSRSVTSGMLMSVGYKGIGGQEGMGLWGPLLFSIPLLAAWYSFERLASIRRTYEQTIGALSVVPELAGLVRSGPRDAGRGSLGQPRSRAAALAPRPRVPPGRGAAPPPRPPLPRRPEVRGRAIEPSEVDRQGRRDPAPDRVPRARPATCSRPTPRRSAARSCASPARSTSSPRATPRSTTRRSKRCTQDPATSTTRECSTRSSECATPDVGSRSRLSSVGPSTLSASSRLERRIRHRRVEVDPSSSRPATRVAGTGAARPAARPEGQVDEADRDHEVTERDRRVHGRPEHDVVTELGQDVVRLSGRCFTVVSGFSPSGTR